MRNPSSNKKKNSNVGGSSSNNTTITPCCSKVGLKRGPWTPEEDEVLADYIRKEGEGRWRTLPKRAGLLRCGKSCRLRWMNYLRPSVKRGQIAPDEEDLILRLHRLLGNRWSLIAGRIPGRTDNEIKNYWNTHLSKKLINQGIDPRTHKPLNPPSIPSPSNHSSKPKPPTAKIHQTPSTLHHNHFISTLHHHHHHDHEQQAPAAGNNNLNPADDVSTMGLIRTNDDHLLTPNNEDYDHDINYCSDDVFSSFLNSLINEDAFAAQQHLQSEPHNAMPSDDHDHDPLISITTASATPPYGLGVLWESPLMSATFSQSEPNPKRVLDHDQKHFSNM